MIMNKRLFCKTDAMSCQTALDVLRSGKLLLYPTDTVWGIGCDATDEEAVRKVFELKRRSDSKSLVLLAASLDNIAKYIKEVPEMAVQLVEVNDAPMTIVYPGVVAVEGADTKKLNLIAPSCVAEDGSVGIRIPSGSRFCMELLKAFGRPIVSTSANISGEPTPKSFAEISEEVRQGVNLVIDPSEEGETTGRASQIIKVDIDGRVKIIRG